MASIHSNKESFELLRGSLDSDSASDVSEIVFPVKKKKYRRRLKNITSSQQEDISKSCNCRARTLSLTLFCLVLICWLITLTWLAFVLHNHLNHLTTHVSEVLLISDKHSKVKWSPRGETPDTCPSCSFPNHVLINSCNNLIGKEMNLMPHVSVPLQGGKKMKKRKELDALVAKTNNKRTLEGIKRSNSAGGVSSHDKLLSDSTDDQDYWASSAGSKAFKALKGHRRGYLVKKRTCSVFMRTCSVFLIFTCVVATTAVMWLFVDIREQVSSLRTELNQVVAGIQGVPDALQKCHTLSKDLQKNQSQIMNRLSGFSLLLTNFSLEITDVKSGLQTVQDQLKNSPDLVNNPRLVKDLSASVATFGSQIRDLNSTVSTLKDQNGKLDNLVGTLVSNVTEMKLKLTELSNANAGKGALTEKNLAAEKEVILNVVNQVSRNLSSINDTLSSKLQWTAQDQSKDHNLIENLREMNENLTARVKTLENLCAKESEAKSYFVNEETSGKPEDLSRPTSANFQSPSTNTFPFAGNESDKIKAQQNPP